MLILTQEEFDAYAAMLVEPVTRRLDAIIESALEQAKLYDPP